MRRFWFFLLGFTALFHVPFALGLHYALHARGAPGAPWLALLASACLVALLRGRMRQVMLDRPIPQWRSLLEELYFVHWCAVLGSSALFLLAELANFAHGALRDQPPVSAGTVALGSYLVALALATWGVVVRRRWVRIRTLEVSIVGLSPSFDGYRIAHLSDLHIGSLCPRRHGDRWVEQVNRLDVDLVALTGDYVTSGVQFHRDIAGLLAQLRAKDGVVAVMGNHDYFGDGEPLIHLLRQSGIEVLRNERKTIARAGEHLALAGIDDTWTRRADVRRALEGRDENVPMIALAHDPALFPKLARGGAALVLSGHTHWGQIGAPFLAERYNVSRLSFRYHAGIYRQWGSTLYVHPGLGTTGPPIRFGVPPEITVLQLRCRQEEAAAPASPIPAASATTSI